MKPELTIKQLMIEDFPLKIVGAKRTCPPVPRGGDLDLSGNIRGMDDPCIDFLQKHPEGSSK